VKKLISIGVALALLAMVVLPVGVGAQNWTISFPAYNFTYSKIPFEVLGTGVTLVGNIVNAMNLSGLPFDVTAVTSLLGGWVQEPFSWLTELTGWTMIALGDIISVIQPLADQFGFGNYTGPLANMTYVLGTRMFDTGNLPGNLTATFPAGFGAS